MSDESDFQFSDDDLDESKHSEIVENVLNVNKYHNLKKSSRTEPTLQISEFNLVKSGTGQKGFVQIDELAKALKTRRKHLKISEKVKVVNKKSRTLPKPLEKPQADRIKRSVGYEKNRYLFDRWEAFVTSNRAQAHQVFPLGSVEPLKAKARQLENFTNNWTFKSNLQKELEADTVKVEEFHIEDENKQDEFILTLQELKEKRKEAAKLRAHHRFKEEKARKQNKIKSKKYHRILRKERVRQKLKEFEELQKTNPEEALKKLEEIEKARALERFSLRHKGTGQWAKSKQVRAKYDRESRKVLAEQLQISRDLTQKKEHSESDSEEETLVSDKTLNPWIGVPKTGTEVTSFMSDYKKFYSEQNETTLMDQLHNKTITEDHTGEGNEEEGTDGSYDNETTLIHQNKNKLQNSTQNNCDEPLVPKKKITKRRKPLKIVEPLPTPTKNKSQPKVHNPSGDWDIDDIFDKAEKKLEQILKKKLLKNNTDSKLGKKSKSKTGSIQKQKNKRIDLTMPVQRKKQIIDEEMIEKPLHQEEAIENGDINSLKALIGNDLSITKKSHFKQPASSVDIDPGNFLKPKIATLDSAAPDLMVEDDNTPESSQKNIIIEAFEDNDIVADFTKEKKDELNKDQPQDIDLNLPGWGSWAGTGINAKNQRKRRRFIVKMPEAMPRKDGNRGSLIINEKGVNKMKPHFVSEVPFPFKTVKDYEASIRAPIGNTFVPELAYSRFIRPAVETRSGAIIEPATLSDLMGKPIKQQ